MLNREAGAMPVRSRHCNGEPATLYHWMKSGKVWPGDEPESGDLPVLTRAVMTYGR